MRKILVWNSWNVQHLGDHAVYEQEVRYVVEYASGRYPQKIGDRKYLVRGRIRQRRALQVIYLVLGDAEVDIELLDLVERVGFERGNEVLYVIHARDLKAAEKRLI